MVGAAGLALISLGRSADARAAGPVLRPVRARVRQPPEHGPAAAGLRRFSPDASPSRCLPIRCGPGCSLMAVAIAALGALQYAWNFRGLWADARAAGVAGGGDGQILVRRHESGLARNARDDRVRDRAAASACDVLVRSASAVRSAWGCARGDRLLLRAVALAAARASCSCSLYAANLAFAWTYNVGDAYIFFLPSHYVVALCAGAGVAAIAALSRASVESRGRDRGGALFLLYPAWRGYDTFPAVDRSWDGAPCSCSMSSLRTAISSSPSGRRLRSRRELAGTERGRVLHARAQAGRARGSSLRSSSGWRRATA